MPDFTSRTTIDDIDAAAVTMLSAVSSREMTKIGYRGKTGIILFGLPYGVQFLGRAAKILADLRARGANLVPFGETGKFINPAAIRFVRQLRTDDGDGLCAVSVGVGGVPFALEEKMTPAKADELCAAAQPAGKRMFVRTVDKFHDKPAIPLSFHGADGEIVIRHMMEKRYPWEFPARRLVIDPEQTGLIRTDERCLHVAFNDCAGLALEKGPVEPVPGLRKAFQDMNPAMDADDIAVMVNGFYREKSMQAMRAIGADLAAMNPNLVGLDGATHLACVRPAEVRAVSGNAADGNRLWLYFREAIGNYTAMDYGFWVPFDSEASKEKARRLLSPAAP